jgi:hypothetical protein
VSDKAPPADAAAGDAKPDAQDGGAADAGADGPGGADVADAADASVAADGADAAESGDGSDGSEVGGVCASCDDHDPCTVDVCDPSAGCRHVNASACARPFCQLGACASWRDTDGDGLSDVWETNGYVDMNCNGVDDGPSVDLELPGADPAVADVYVQYDWMDYGPMETPCNTNGDCTILAGLAQAACTGPALTEGYTGSCVLPCAVDADCTSLGPTHATDRCELAGVMQCLHTHDPTLLVPDGNGGSTALATVVETFARHGINLHLVRGSALPHSHVLSLRALDGTDAIAESCEGGSLAAGTAGSGRYAESLYDLKASSFDQSRAVAYHYAVFAHESSCDTAAHCAVCPAPLNTDGSTKSSYQARLGQSGIAELSGNDLVISLGTYVNETGNPPDRFVVGGTFMHELGHNLGLSHGGGFVSDGTAESSPEYKPNYLSVMNYNYQFAGIGVGAAVGDAAPKACALDADCPPGAHCNLVGRCRRLDYSTQVLPTGTATPGLLDENGRLDETAGLGSRTSDTFFFTDGACQFREAATNGPVDWDGDGVAGDDATATAELNPAAQPDKPCGSVTSEQFRGHADWGPGGAPQFTHAFQCTAAGGD